MYIEPVEQKNRISEGQFLSRMIDRPNKAVKMRLSPLNKQISDETDFKQDSYLVPNAKLRPPPKLPTPMLYDIADSKTKSIRRLSETSQHEYDNKPRVIPRRSPKQTYDDVENIPQVVPSLPPKPIKEKFKYKADSILYNDTEDEVNNDFSDYEDVEEIKNLKIQNEDYEDVV
jgi:hypothetical protein